MLITERELFNIVLYATMSGYGIRESSLKKSTAKEFDTMEKMSLALTVAFANSKRLGDKNENKSGSKKTKRKN